MSVVHDPLADLSPIRVTVDLAILAVQRGELALCVVGEAADGDASGWTLPWTPLHSGVSLESAARSALDGIFREPPATIEQVIALDAKLAHPADADLSVGYVALMRRPRPPVGAEWVTIGSLQAVPARQRALVRESLGWMRRNLEQRRLAFTLVPGEFTLAELQRAHELILGRALHKASFRRTVESAGWVEDTGSWRGKGRGRPARLFRESLAARGEGIGEDRGRNSASGLVVAPG